MSDRSGADDSSKGLNEYLGDRGRGAPGQPELWSEALSQKQASWLAQQARELARLWGITPSDGS